MMDENRMSKMSSVLGEEFFERIDNLLIMAKSYNIMIESCLSHYIEKMIEELNIGNIGSVWLSRHNTDKTGAFLIKFSPTEEERKRKNISYLQTSIGMGRFLSRKMYFYNKSKPKYLSEKIIPALTEFFIKFDFYIVDSEKKL